MPKTTEVVRREENSLEVQASSGMGEALLVENVGGLILLTVAGRVARGEERDIASLAIDRDTLKHDVAHWINQEVNTGEPLDPQTATDEAFRIIALKDIYEVGRSEIRELESREKRLTSRRGQDAAKLDLVITFMQEAVDEYGAEAIAADAELKAKILREAAEVESMSATEIANQLALLKAEIEEKASQLEVNTGAALTTFAETAPEGLKKIIQPVRILAQLGILSAGESFEGLASGSVEFETYGPSTTKLAINIPANLNSQPMPMSYTEAATFANTIVAKTTKTTSIWDRT